MIEVKLSNTNYPSFLSDVSDENGILFNNQFDEISELRSIENFNKSHREILVNSIKEDLIKWNAPQNAFEANTKILNENCYTIMSGQQPGLCCSPLYIIYKAIGTIKLAEKLSLKFPDKQFVPVFWLEGDDHDFDEIRNLGIINNGNEYQKLWLENDDNRRLHVGERFVNVNNFQKLISCLKDSLIETEFTNDLLDKIKSFYIDSNFSDGFSKLLYYILGNTNLIIASSRNPSLKRLAKNILKKEILNPEILFNSINLNTLELQSNNIQTPIKLTSPQTFITHENERLSLEIENGSYHTKNKEIVFTKNKLSELTDLSPEIFSPKVTLRPIMQDAIFPTAVFLGGPTELAYLRQIRPGYSVMGIIAPIIAPRPFVFILESRVKRNIENVKIDFDKFFNINFDLLKDLVDENVLNEIITIKENLKNELNDSLKASSTLIDKYDSTLNSSLLALISKTEKEIEILTQKIISSIKKRHKISLDRYNNIIQSIMPNKIHQERALSPLYFINKYGLDKFQNTFDKIDCKNGILQIIEIN